MMDPRHGRFLGRSLLEHDIGTTSRFRTRALVRHFTSLLPLPWDYYGYTITPRYFVFSGPVGVCGRFAVGIHVEGQNAGWDLIWPDVFAMPAGCHALNITPVSQGSLSTVRRVC